MIIGPVKNIARSLCCGTKRRQVRRGTQGAAVDFGRPKVASSEATTMSALPASPMPPPRQKPCTAAMTGTSQS